uniref:KIAA0947 n=1 Tax=Iconisemion striatum TaxID=60296 RepID=A0A1A7WFE4_9TELE
MMPGDSQSKTAAIAADATVGQCQNCSVLHQSLTEYVSSFLALKQKITVSDDTIRLQQQLEELQIRLVTLEKKTADYESLQAELEQKKGALKAYEQLSEKMEQLKQENNKTVAENKNLEDQLKCVKEEQSLESAQLRREKAAMENDLLQTQESLKKCQAEADKTEILEKQNASLINMRDDLENKVQQFEESICKQNHQISQLTTEKKLIEININDLQVRLMKHERERCKEFKSAATQASVPTEPKLDKEKVRMLLQNLWACVDPKEEQSESQLHLPESSCRQILPSPPHPKHKSKQSQMSPSASQKISESNCYLIQTKATNVQLKPSPRSQNDAKSQASPRRLSEKKQAGGCKNKMQVPKQHKPDEQSPRRSRQEVSVDEILEMFRPMLPCISPLPDLDSERESVKMEEGQKEGHPERSEDFTVPKQDNLLNIPSVSLHKSPSFSTSQKEENGDLSEVTTQEYQNISKEDDFGQSGLCAVADVNNELIEDCEKDHSENDMLPEEEMASPSSSKSGGNVLPLATETREDSCGEILNSCADSISETKNVLEETKDYLDSVTEMDVDPSLTDVLDATAITANSGQQLRDNDVLLHPEEKQPVAVLASCESLKGTDVMENGSEVEKLHQDSCWSNLDTTVFKILESSECVISEMPDHPSSSSDSMSCVSNINLKEKMESDGIHLCVDNNGNAALETGGTDCTTSPSELISDNTPVTLVLKEEDNKQHSDQERSELNSKTSPKKDVDTETKNVKVPVKSAPLFSDSPENVAVDCKSLEKSRHSACRRLSPTCILPSIKLEAVVMEQSTENRVSPTLSRDAEGIKQVAVKEFSQNSADPGCTVSLIKDTSLAKGQNECLETCEAMHGNQSSHGIVDGKGSSKGTPTSGQTPEFISHVLSEMGPPLPPVLTPLTTPPKAGKSINPRNAIEKLSFPSPMGGVASPTTPVEAQLCSSSLNSPTPPHGVLSSPLQFDSATPKHALPVPGRLPSKANNSSPSASASPPQGNSMKILDAMYPELSACARTLSILRGNVSLSMCSSESGTLPTSDGQVSSFKAISSTSTAFTKTESRREKRPAECLSQPKKSKCPKLGVSSADVTQKEMLSVTPSGEKDTPSPCTQRVDHFKTVSPEAEETDEHDIIVNSLEKIRNQCFDLLPVLQSHLYVGNLPKKPVLRDEEKDVISDICKPGSPQIEDMMLSILNKLKAEKSVLSTNYTQALCRVYTGICRQKSYWEKARILAYSILMEDFPDSAKLVLFMVSTWPNVLSNGSLLCQAIHTITKLKAQEGLLSCLSKFLGWEKNPPCDIDQLISRTVSELRLGSKQSFSKHSRYGEDLGNEAWEQIYTLQLLCSYKKWKWTYEHILGNELWPLMNSWVTQPRGQQEPVSDVNVATVLRLIGRLCQLGLKESCVTSVVTVANVINTFGRHGQTEGVPWEVQLAAIYCIYDLSPSNPKQALSALAEWRGETTQKVPPAVTSFINQIASICRQSKR